MQIWIASRKNAELEMRASTITLRTLRKDGLGGIEYAFGFRDYNVESVNSQGKKFDGRKIDLC
jgi:hypothetical protein